MNRICHVLILTLVLWLAHGCASHRPAFEHLDDATIELLINARLSEHASTAALDVDVYAYDGVVTLTGRVPSEEVRQALTRAANTTSGVRRVVNRIHVDASGGPLMGNSSQESLLKNVRSRLSGIEGGSTLGIDISVDGIVTLDGVVSSEEVRNELERATATAPGAKHVVSRIRLVDATEPDVEIFPMWPPPSPSSRMIIPSRQFVGSPMSRVVRAVVGALEAADYRELSYFRSPAGGVVIAARLERFRATGEFEPPPERYKLLPRHITRDFFDRLASLVRPPIGRYRLLLFFVGVEPFSPGRRDLPEGEAKDLTGYGSVRLPASYADKRYTSDDDIQVFVYEYEQRGLGMSRQVTTLSVKDHLHGCGIDGTFKDFAR